MTVIAFTANDRVDYMTEVLDSWRKVDGIEDAHLIFRVEPGCPEMLQLCASATFGRTLSVIPNIERYGALTNPWHAFENGFVVEDFVILAEDDSIVSNDVLYYFDFASRHFARDEVLAVCAFQSQISGSDPARVYKDDWFAPTIWGTWVDRWVTVLRDTWDFDYTHKGWDWHIRLDVMPPDWRCVFPAMSRSQHIGAERGTHMQPSDFAGLQSRCFQESYDPVTFVET